MISKIDLKDLNDFNSLGLQVNSKFNSLFDLGKILDSSYEFVYGYYIDEKLVGFVHVSKSFEVLDIINIVVDSNYRKKGIGSELINYVIDSFKDIESIMLEVNENNKSAISLYYKNGFKIISRRVKYYGNDDALIMKRDV